MTTQSTVSSSPPSKRPRLESTPIITATRTSQINDETSLNGEGSDELENQCSICLQSILDCTVVPACSHEFCFECILVWIGAVCKLISRQCHNSPWRTQSNPDDAHYVPKLSDSMLFTTSGLDMTFASTTLPRCARLQNHCRGPLGRFKKSASFRGVLLAQENGI